MKVLYSLCVLAFISICILIPDYEQIQKEPRLNDIQVIGSHNSYKIGIGSPLLNLLVQKDSKLSSLQYEHIPLTDQLNLGLRSLELDIFYDPEGGYYSNPKGLELVKQQGVNPMPFDEEEKLKKPGLKVFHVQEFDFRSHQLIFTEALQELKKWSLAHERHTPIIITINAKDAEIPQTRKPMPFDAEALKTIDKEIKSVFENDRLITPDLVRGNYASLENAILEKGWPYLNEVKNRFLFVLDEGNEKADAYLSNFPLLKGAVLFLNEEEGKPNAAFRIVNDPIQNFEKIKELVTKGYMVRTRSDANTIEARNNEYTRFQKAKASGANIITTDYYLPSNLFKSDFQVRFKDGTFERIKP
ncbi:phosphatidylinositol-specific phospholipase C1-like protein [Cytophaga sp. FL35]|uniref:phosphatidylinositol-specific phospholipase C1-like protein n=1 Tax=Cytophaga sp. FL35 TaxID=1904456 RepID=UPI001653695C|nr:phosphatidylinositol-specific phospholipase C1-like protein [Cytophaga sp. FL35]MBC6999070.1 phosphatidylinositol-specific phospholipase C1-like protein [Cytophaga sp. FL35]